jgi:hypothetical protein
MNAGRKIAAFVKVWQCHIFTALVIILRSYQLSTYYSILLVIHRLTVI